MLKIIVFSTAVLIMTTIFFAWSYQGFGICGFAQAPKNSQCFVIIQPKRGELIGQVLHKYEQQAKDMVKRDGEDK